MASERDRELAQYAQGKPSEVRDRGTYGWYQGSMVNRSGGGEVTCHGDRIKVIDGMIFKNGSYVGRAQ